MSYIKVENASVIYNEGSDNQVNALLDINLEIEKNEFVIFFGPSGCGKTTLLNLISGLEKTSSGDVFIEEEDVANLDADQMARFHCDKIGMVFQAYNLISSLTVLDNVVLPSIFGGQVSKEDRKDRGRALLKRFGVLPQQNKFPAQLSGGQQQRVGIARALINDQPIILADEPVGNLDSKSARNVLSLLSDLNREENKTIIMVTHNAEHLDFADHIFYLKDGRITNETFGKKKKNVKLKDLKPEEKEFELLSRSFAGLSDAYMNVLVTPFKAKVLSNYVLNALSFNQNKRLEDIITKRLSGEMDSKKFGLLLDKPYEQGGVGLNFQTAKNYFYNIETIISNVNILQTDFSDIVSRLKLSEDELRTKLIVRHFVREHVAKSSVNQIKIFEKVILSRIKNEIDNEQVFKILDAPEKDGGAGFDVRAVRSIVEEMEIIMMMKFSQSGKNTSFNSKDIFINDKRNSNLIFKDVKHIENIIDKNE